MRVEFKTEEMAKWFTDAKAARKALGDQIGKAYRRQIELLQAAATSVDLSRTPQLHFKALAKGTVYEGKYSVRLSGFVRMIVSVSGQVVTIEEVTKHYEG